jgi:FkbM family methyltransferase
MEKLFFDQNNCGYVEKHGITIRFRGQLRFWETVASNAWEAHTFDVIKRHLKKDNDFVDIGAWNGVTSIFASNLCSSVFCAEPDPEAFKLLVANVEENKKYGTCQNILHTPFAISNATRGESLYTNNEFGSSMSSLNERSDNKNSIPVFCATLPDYVQNQGIDPFRIGLLKIDTEGGEVKILQGADEWIGEYLPPMYVSFHPFWYEDFENDVRELMNVVYQYPFVRDVNGKDVTKADFIELNNMKQGFELVLSEI